MEEMKNLVVIKSGITVLSDDVEKYLDEYKTAKEKFETAEKNFRDKLLQLMIDNNITSQKVGKYTISQILGKDKEEFDNDKFLENESEEVISLFSEIQTSCHFNEEKFKEENPNLYNKYLEEENSILVDVKKLSKNFPDIYNKYVKITKSTKKPTLRIGEK